MTARILPVAEWPRLAGTLLRGIWPQLDPQFAEVLVVEDAGAIVGSVALITVLHAECLTVPSQVGAARALWRLLRDRVAVAGARAVWGSAVDAPMDRLLTKHAQPIPGAHFLLPMPETVCRL